VFLKKNPIIENRKIVDFFQEKLFGSVFKFRSIKLVKKFYIDIE